ncbi:hypothetical protein FACS1894139_13870 [Planctomycetales bacterium]|nr:hypothetical protein FACS1894107_06830 [Planctomycetales bacterium]GHS98648.1 hypothetical protein FACS1894108_07190 [Planctomycetales bacterium]GHT06897.1 hypothetical protein FACS1894139_13870 [Planctomycetales bacterium]
MFTVKVKRKIARDLAQLPPAVQNRFRALVVDLEQSGARQTDWANFSALGNNRYPCHLTYRYVACWTFTKGTIDIEVYYVGSRESAPY